MKKLTYISKLQLISYRNSTFNIRHSKSKFELPRNTYITSTRVDCINKNINPNKEGKIEKTFKEKEKIKVRKGTKQYKSATEKWSNLELRALENFVEKHGQNWDLISKQIVVRSAGDCRNKYLGMTPPLSKEKQIKKEKSLNNGPVKRIWTEEEIKLLDNLLIKYGRRWSKIEKYFSTKEAKTIEYFVNSNPNKFSTFFKFPNRLGRAKIWTENEVKMLNDLLAKYGKNYDLIAKHLHGRSALAIVRALPKHYLDLPTLRNIKIQKCFKISSRWSDRETNLLNDLVAHFGPYWVSVAANLPGRTQSACKFKYNDCWHFHNDKTEVTLHKWPQELIQVLDLILAKYGRWQILPILLPGITPMHCQVNNLKDYQNIPPRHSEWKDHDKILLKHLIKKHDFNLDKIKPYFPHKSRSAIKCQLRSNPELLTKDKISESGKEMEMELNDVFEIDQINPNRWTTTELKKLFILAREHDSNWFKIAENLPGRTPTSCWLRYVILSRKNNNVGKNWTIKDLICFIELFQKYGPDWDLIAQHFTDKKPSDIQYLVHHNTLITTNLNIFQHEMRRWSSEDLVKFKNLYEIHGPDWQAIADYLPGKTHEDCLECYHSHKDLFADNLKVGPRVSYQRKLISWSETEKRLLKDLIEKYNEDFDRIAKFFPGRASTSIRTYYSQHQEELGLKDCSLDEIEKKAPWTGNEENKLINLVRLYHEEWKQISYYLPNRSPEACRRKYYNILHPEVPSSEFTY
ncbi:hypothetical protein Glove_402g14 [Diversispora epigaea]|uniref:Uncharacterized protein n=1 Tax=Diversispora epigaea TaxID=1348612 RepID=A0A397H065_9GLOM|nr:hypothetical protein Glove_402g14 [Diversispora epigaea]